MMIKKREKLHYIKHKSAYMETFHPPYLYKMSKKNASISCQMLLDSFQLTWMNEIGYNSMDLQSLVYHFFNYLAKHVEKHDGTKDFRDVIQGFI